MHASIFMPLRGTGARGFTRRGRAPLGPKAAFTILEVVIATSVLVFAITTSITTLQRAFLALDTARKITLAGQIMQTELETIRLEDWKTLTDTSKYPASADLTSTKIPTFATSAAITNTFTLTRTISDVHSEMKQITLTTTWKTTDGRVLSRSYTTYYAKNGLYDYFYNSF